MSDEVVEMSDAENEMMFQALKMARSYKAQHPEMVKVNEVIARIIKSGRFANSIKDLRQAIFYLTDEDYINERHAIMFFAEKLFP